MQNYNSEPLLHFQAGIGNETPTVPEESQDFYQKIGDFCSFICTTCINVQVHTHTFAGLQR